MKSYKHHDTESINYVIKQMEKVISSLKSVRKKRGDYGVKRKKYNSNLPLKYRQYMASANKRSIKFELTVEEFEQILMGTCVYCGSNAKTGIDRIDSRDGYNIENVQPCCTTCNMMKFTHDEDFFLEHIIKIFKHRQLIHSKY